MSPWHLIGKHLGPKRLLAIMRFWPPFLGAGIRVRARDDSLRALRVEMPLTRWNQNYVGTQFGGSLFAMCDPFHMVMLMQALGPDYLVWDKRGSIDFIRPGRGRVHADIELAEDRLSALRAELAEHGKSYPEFSVDIVDDEGHVIARVHKLVSVRAKGRVSAKAAG